MAKKWALFLIVVGVVITAFTSVAQEVSYTVLLEGLNQPRGVEYDANGVLYVVEAGRGGTDSIAGPFDGDVLFGFSSQVSAYQDGELTPVITYLPSAQVESAPGAPLEALGAMDVGFADGELWVLTGHQLPNISTSGLAIGFDSTTLRPIQVVDLYGYELANDTDGTLEFLSNGNSIEFYPDSKTALITDSGANAVFRKAENGAINPVLVWEDNPVPTGLDFSDDGTIYAVGFLSGYPFASETARVDVYNAETHDLLISYGGLTTVTDVLIEPDGTILAVEYAVFNIDLGGWVRDSGRIIAISPDGTITPLLSGLNFPYSISKNPVDGTYAISVNAVGDFGTGQVISMSISQPTEE